MKAKLFIVEKSWKSWQWRKKYPILEALNSLIPKYPCWRKEIEKVMYSTSNIMSVIVQISYDQKFEIVQGWPLQKSWLAKFFEETNIINQYRRA